MLHKDIRFISGMHRSGTTWVGQVVQHALPQSVICLLYTSPSPRDS